MTLIEYALVAAALLCGLVAGFVFCFAVVVIPGIRTLDDREFLRSFKVMDKIIQDTSPLFVLVSLGTALVLLGTTLLAFSHLEGSALLLVVAACAIFLVGVQFPTFIINIPLNNRVQSLDLDSLSEGELHQERRTFEPRWTRWNSIRTVLATVVTALLLLVLAGF